MQKPTFWRAKYNFFTFFSWLGRVLSHSCVIFAARKQKCLLSLIILWLNFFMGQASKYSKGRPRHRAKVDCRCQKARAKGSAVQRWFWHHRSLLRSHPKGTGAVARWIAKWTLNRSDLSVKNTFLHIFRLAEPKFYTKICIFWKFYVSLQAFSDKVCLWTMKCWNKVLTEGANLADKRE